ncbi:MAG: hypothetical protein K9N05_03360 [Candidatus Marinimicrobia bacterium]|nr:hypothetical protein [Candidatus Neomarinimicrobiota bacterium]
MMFSLLRGVDDVQENSYRQAITFEKSGEYSKAESLYVDLYSTNPDNFNYFTRYKNMLIQQRKYKELLPVLEKRVEDRYYDTYQKLELSVLYYTLGEQSKADKIWRSVFDSKTKSMVNSYANSIYQDVLEYGQGNSFYLVTRKLREITNNRELLVQYNFTTSLRYRNWDEAVKEIIEILKSNSNNLRYVRNDLFRYEPESDLYQRVIAELSGIESTEGKELLSEVYIHLQDYQSAFDVLSGANNDQSMNDAMLKFANRMFIRAEYAISHKAAKWAEQNFSNEEKKISMALLGARSQEQMFYKQIKKPSLVFVPFASDFTNLRFEPFGLKETALIESAYLCYDSLSGFHGIQGEMASLRHAEISYRVYQDFDRALEEYITLADKANMKIRRDVLSRISDIYMAKGEYESAVLFLENAGSKYRLMVHEEDRLLPQRYFSSIIAGDMDSITERTMYVLAMLPKEDPLYNDVLAFAGFINIIAKDTLSREYWLEGERYILKNNIAQAREVFKDLLDKNSPAKTIYAIRYLDCINVLQDQDAEGVFWDNYYQMLLKTDMADYFMLRYAEYYEIMQKFEIAIEIFEKYLLSYQESMYYENIREYVRQHYSIGRP